MTKYFATDDNPAGWKLEYVLSELQNELVRRSMKIISDHRPEARLVLNNNIDILGWLARCVTAAEESTRVLDSFGPSAGPQGTPRIGEP